MSLKSRLLTAFSALSLFAVGCATGQGATTQAGGTSTVEELPADERAAGQQAAQAGPQLNTIGGPEDGFTAKMPGTPQVVRNKVTIPAGDVTTAAWTTNVDGAIYSLSTADYPEKIVVGRPAEAFLNEGRDGLVTQLKGTVKSEENLTINDTYPGKAFTITSDSGEVKARNYLVGSRLYTMLVLYNPSIGAPAADEFLRSLELINPPPPLHRGASTSGTTGAGTTGGTPAPTESGTPAPTEGGTPAPAEGGTTGGTPAPTEGSTTGGTPAPTESGTTGSTPPPTTK